MIEAVIFDIDGTLVDTVDFHVQSWQRTFTHFGHQIPDSQIRAQIGKGSDKLMPVFFSLEQLNQSDEGPRPMGERMRDYRREIYKREYHSRIKAFPLVRELFLLIKANGKRIAKASSATWDDLATYIQILNVEDLVDAATTTTEVKSSKPDPDLFLVTLNKLGDIASHDVIVVGDTPYDAEAAGKANLRTIGVLSGGFSAENLSVGRLYCHLPKYSRSAGTLRPVAAQVVLGRGCISIYKGLAKEKRAHCAYHSVKIQLTTELMHPEAGEIDTNLPKSPPAHSYLARRVQQVGWKFPALQAIAHKSALPR